MLVVTQPLQTLTSAKKVKVPSTKSYLDTISAEIVHEVNVTYGIDCSEQVYKIVNRYTVRNTAKSLFYAIFGTLPKVGTKVSISDVVDATDGKGVLTGKTLKVWKEKGVPYGKGSLADVRFVARKDDQPACYELVSYVEGRF